MPPLRLIALDVPDLEIVSAHLQDAVCTVADMAYRPGEKRFVALLNRFNWASVGTKGPPERRQAALRIERVENARVQGIDLTARASVLSLLAVIFEADPDPGKAPAGVLHLRFAGGAAARFDVECIEVQLEDLGPAWQARAVPDHDRQDGEDRS
jgi:hypothetical protein